MTTTTADPHASVSVATDDDAAAPAAPAPRSEAAADAILLDSVLKTGPGFYYFIGILLLLIGVGFYMYSL